MAGEFIEIRFPPATIAPGERVSLKTTMGGCAVDGSRIPDDIEWATLASVRVASIKSFVVSDVRIGVDYPWADDAVPASAFDADELAFPPEGTTFHRDAVLSVVLENCDTFDRAARVTFFVRRAILAPQAVPGVHCSDKAVPDAATVAFVLESIDAELAHLQQKHGEPEFADGDGHNIALEKIRHFIAKALSEARARNAEPVQGRAADLSRAAKLRQSWSNQGYLQAPYVDASIADLLATVRAEGVEIGAASPCGHPSETEMPALTDLEKREAEHTRQVLLFAAEKALLVKIVEAAEAYVEAPTLRTLLGQRVSETDNWAARGRLRKAISTWRGMPEKGEVKP